MEKNSFDNKGHSNRLVKFFNDGLYNDYKAIEELLKDIELTNNEALATSALQAYQQHYSCLKEPWNHVPITYGLGLLYMYFNAYDWSIKAFRQTLYVEPNFERSNDVHARLGLIFKTLKDFDLSAKHFHIALHDHRPCNFSSLDIKFHLAHLLEIRGKFRQAEEAYEKLLLEDGITQTLSAIIHRQLGYMHYSDETLAPPQNSLNNHNKQQIVHMQQGKLESALSYLELSYKANCDSKTSYYLGRCLTSMGKYRDAFASYRSAVDKEESTADTWCSLGVLYHQQNQPNDALQAYIRSVQFDKTHTIAWSNLGALYEHHNQFQDALKCYQHVQRSNASNVDRPIQDRIKFLQSQLTSIEASSNDTQVSNRLIGLEDLWNLERSKNDPTLSVGNNHPTDKQSHYSSQNPLVSQTRPAALLSGATLKNGPNHVKPNPNINGLVMYNGINNINTSMNKSEQVAQHQITKQEHMYADQSLPMKNPNYGSSKNSSQLSPDFLINMTTEQVIESCKNLSPARKIDINLLSYEETPPCRISAPYPPLKRDKLNPPAPSIFLESKKEALSCKLRDLCLTNPITVVRNMASVLKLDLGLFSTKTLVETGPDHPIEIQTYLFQHPEENWNLERNRTVWRSDYRVSQTTIGRYANYQAASFRESLQEEQEMKSNHHGSASSKQGLNRESETDSNGSTLQGGTKLNTGQQQQQASTNKNNNIKKMKRDLKIKLVRSASKIDISDEKIWRPQLHELTKLPSFVKCSSASNILSHIGDILIGVNTVDLSMKVPGCRVLGHQEEGNLCRVNINVGPGDCEWFAVPEEYSVEMAKLCEKNGLNFIDGSWWPKLTDLLSNDIPVYRFLQRPGDLVWVNSGTIYWIQAIGWCNNISWSVGPLCAKQYKSAAFRYEWNKLVFRKSLIPMIQVTWNIANNIATVFDENLFTDMKHVLFRTLRYCRMVRELIKKSDKKILSHKKEDGLAQSKYCSICEFEVFNLFLTRSMDKKLYCVQCALRLNSGFNDFIITEEHDLEYLLKIYNNFTWKRDHIKKDSL